MKTVQELYDERAKVLKDQRAMLDKAEGEKRDLSADEKLAFEKMEADYASLTERIKRAEVIAEREKEERSLARIVTPPASPAATAAEDRAKFLREVEDYIRTTKNAELRASTDPQSLSSAYGGYTVPNEWFNELQQARLEANIMRRLARVVTKGPGTLTIPTVSAHGVAAWYTENSSIAVAGETFSYKTLSSIKAGRIITITRELLQDSLFDLASYIMTELGRSIGVLEETGFISGNNSDQPNGIFTAATTGVTTASATAITADELINLFHSITAPYRNASSACWIMNDSTALLIRKLKDGNQQYLWQPGLQAGQPDRLLARPVFTSANAPAATATLNSVLFGDIRCYWIADRQGLDLQRLDELYAVNDLTGFKGTIRTDGELIDTGGVRVLTMHS